MEQMEPLARKIVLAGLVKKSRQSEEEAEGEEEAEESPRRGLMDWDERKVEEKKRREGRGRKRRRSR